MNFKLIHIIFFYLGIIPTLFSQEYIAQITPLPENEYIGSIVNFFFEDSRGYMWIPGKNRLCRFDGNKLKSFFHDKDLPQTKTCTQIVEDVRGNIWVYFFNKVSNRGLYHGQYQYLINSDFEIQTIDEYYEEKMPFKSSEILLIHQDYDRVLYMLIDGGHLYKYDGEFKKIATLPLEGKALINQVNEKGEIILTTSHFIWKVSSDGQHIDKKSYFLSNPILTSSIIPKDSLFISYFFDGTLKIIRSPFTKKLYSQKLIYPDFWNALPDNQDIIAYYLTSKGRVVYLIATQDRFVLFNKNGQLIFDFPFNVKQIGKPNHFPNHFFHRENQVWFCTNKGVYILNYTPARFKNYFNNYGGFSTRGVITYPDNVLALSSRTIGRKKLSTNEIKLDTIPKGNFLWGVCKNDNNTLLFGTNNPCLYEYDPGNESTRYITVKNKDLPANFNLSAHIPFKDKKNNIYVGTTRGLYVHNPATDSLEVFKKYNEYLGLKKASISFFKEEADGIWIATSNGLFLLDEERGIIKSHESLADFRVNHFHREDSIFWLTSYGKGLLKFNTTTKEIQKFGHENGFFSEYLTAIYPDNHGYLWIASEKGLIRFNHQNHESRIFFESDGLTHNEFNRNSHFRDKNGKIFLGGLNGVISFHPDSIPPSLHRTSPFVLTDFEVYNDEKGVFENRNSQYQKERIIKLSPEERTFQIYFSLLNYFETDKTRFAYTIDGLYTNWIQQKEHFIKFNEIPFGNYTLRIKAKANAEDWNQQDIVIPLVVSPPFYLQLHWQIFLGLILLFLFFIGYKWRVKSLQKERVLLEQKIRERTKTIEAQNQKLTDLNDTKDRLFAILAHDLRNPVLAFKSLSKSINYLISNQETNRILELGKFIEKEANQLHHLLDNLLNWALAKQEKLPVFGTTLSLFEIAEKIVKDYQHLSELSKVSLINNIPSEAIIFADRRILETVFRNIVSNAFRYTKAGDKIIFSVTPHETRKEIFIEDTGSGMSQSQMDNLFRIKSNSASEDFTGKMSIGLHLCQELITLLGGEISVSSKLSKGSIFKIELPENKINA